ncbi:MAG: ATP-binding cassette domain-containing protein [Chitinophagaceae bacterium]
MGSSSTSISKAIRKLNLILWLDRSDLIYVYTLAIFAGLVQLSLPLGIQSIIGFVMAGSISTSIVILIGLVVFGVFINGLLQVRQLQTIEKVKQKLFLRYALEYADRLPKLNIEKLDNEYLPEIVNKFFDSISLQKSIDKLVIDLPAAIIQVLLGLLLLAFYHPVFIAFGVLLLVAVFLIIRFTSSQGLSTAMDASSYKYAVAGWLQQIARTVKTFKYTRETSIHINKTDEMAIQYLASSTKHFKILLTQFWSLISFKIIITAAMLIIGSYLLVSQQINVGQFIAADIVIITIIGSIEKLIMNLDAVYDALVSVEKLNIITEAEKEGGGSLLLEVKNGGVSLECNNISFAYGDNAPVLANFNLVIEKGEMVQLKGASGVGKSTVLRLFTGAFINYTGNILIDGIPLANYNIASLRQQTGIMLGNQDLFQGTIKENITMGSHSIRMQEISSMAALTGLLSFIQTCKDGYDTMLLPGGHKLSNSVRKNILLIRALLGDHRLLLLEEPFEHLEQPYKNKVIDYIKNNKNSTVLIASKDEGLKANVDKIVLLNKAG